MKRLLDCVVLVACVAVAGCGSGANKNGSGGNGGGGGGTGVGSCSVPTPCGGNIVGTWRLASACGAIASSACPASQTISVNTTWSDATYTFAANGTVTLNASGTTTENIRYPVGCLAIVVDAGATEACAAYQNLVQATIQNADGGAITSITSFACSMDGSDACLCRETITGATETLNDTYTVSGNQLTFIPPASADAGSGSATTEHGEYCVSGNTLILHLLDASGAPNDFVMTLTRVN